MYLIESWSSTPAWKELSTEERQQFFEAVREAMEPVADWNKCLGWGIVDHDTDASTNDTYVAIWNLDDDVEVDTFLDTLRQKDWYTYFNQTNAKIHLVEPPEVIEKIIKEGS